MFLDVEGAQVGPSFPERTVEKGAKKGNIQGHNDALEKVRHSEFGRQLASNLFKDSAGRVATRVAIRGVADVFCSIEKE